MTESSNPTVSIIIPCCNEVRYIGGCLTSVLDQEDLPAGGSFEVIVADGMSGDGTREIVQAFADRDPRVRLIDNPKHIVATGMNLAIKAARGDVIVRMDAHTEYAKDYVRRCVEVLERTGAENVGGPARTKSESYLQKANSLAYHSKFSVGGARFHDVSYEGYVDTVAYGCWRKATLERMGLFDEDLVRNQDDELNFRTIRRGGRIWQSPSIRSWYYPRDSIRKLFRQYFQYGYWKVSVIQKHGGPASWRHLVPATFLGCLLIAGLLGLFSGISLWVFTGMVLCYGTLSVAAGALACRSPENRHLFPIMPLIFGAYHLGYATGFLAGVFDCLRRNGDRSEAFSEDSLNQKT